MNDQGLLEGIGKQRPICPSLGLGDMQYPHAEPGALLTEVVLGDVVIVWCGCGQRLDSIRRHGPLLIAVEDLRRPPLPRRWHERSHTTHGRGEFHTLLLCLVSR